jgi:type VI secretion system protein ImpK
MEPSKNQLMNLCLPLFTAVRLLQSEQAAELAPDFGESLFQSVLSIEYIGFEDAKYAVAALLDETIMRSGWAAKHTWMNQSLQLRLFGEHTAGVNFFNRLSRIRQNGELNIDVLKIYFVCLQLGFQGKYAMTQQEELKALQVDIKHQLDLYQGGLNPSLSFDLESTSDKSLESTRKMPDWGRAAVFLGAIVLVYSVYGLRFQHLHQTHGALIDQAILQVAGAQ